MDRNQIQNELAHYGVLGMKWGVRRYQNKDGTRTAKGQKRYSNLKKGIVEGAYAITNKVMPREQTYKVKRAFNKPKSTDMRLASLEVEDMKSSGILTTNENSLKALEKIGIEKHKNTVYENLTPSDISNFKKYTDAAVYSRAVNTYLATGSPEEIAEKASRLKESLRKNSINDQVVYRSCNIDFTTPGIGKKKSTYGEEELKTMFNSISKDFMNKSFGENRIYSTSTSPLFAIDTWRKVNPTAAKTYNAYLIIDCKNTPGVYADGRTSSGGKLVNTRSNQECILAPNKMVYKRLAYDEERKMFAIYMEAN